MEIIHKYRILKLITIVASSIILLISLTQVAYVTDYSDPTANVNYAIGAFLLGWMNIIGAGISWLANPLLLLSWIYLFKRLKFSLVFSLLSILFCCSFLFFDSVISSEGGGKSNIISYGNGYWLWVSSCTINFIGILTIVIKKRNSC